MAPLPGAAGRIAAMQEAGRATQGAPGFAGPLSNLWLQDEQR
jgi:hypothetical protein